MKARTDELYLYDILECCQKIETYLAGITKDDFDRQQLYQDAVVRNIEIIGEAAKCLSEELRNARPEVAWKEVMRMRDKVVHHYFRINLDIVWQTAVGDIPSLRSQIEKISVPDEN
ncbi:MAG: DUF86 domain-containing protein [Pyrinomonadaceae bacterium]|nr:DUF86 domain-containing protein [Pyrinomonadaceae bacterium]